MEVEVCEFVIWVCGVLNALQKKEVGTHQLPSDVVRGDSPAAAYHLGVWSDASIDLSSRIKSMKDIKTVITASQLNAAAKYLHAQKKQTGEVHEELALELASSKSKHSQASKMAKLDRDKRITFQNSSLNTTEVPTRLCSSKAGSAQRVLNESHVNKLMVRF